VTESSDAPSRFLIRNVFNPALIDRLARQISAVWPAFAVDAFCRDCCRDLAALSFGDRNKMITDHLTTYLPKDFEQASTLLIAALGVEASDDAVGGYDGFEIMPQTTYISRHGMDHYELSMKALYEMTKRFSAEFDIRPFIERYPDQTLSFLHTLTEDKSAHARRLASEGTRPRLPWGRRLRQFQNDPTPLFALLDRLKNDESLMVRRSVANNLNDIAKDHPDQLVEYLQGWQAGNDVNQQWIIKHGLRTLIKQGHRGALALLGYAPPAVEIKGFSMDVDSIQLGEALSFSFEVHSSSSMPQSLIIDYVIHFMKANGKQAAKTFKLGIKQLAPMEHLVLYKKHPFKRMTTRKLYAGAHTIECQINGERFGRWDFKLCL